MPGSFRTVFVSAVSSQYAEFRRLLAERLRSPVHNVILQDNLSAQGRSLTQTLEDWVKKSSLVVHLAGTRAGETPERNDVLDLLELLERTLPFRSRLSQRFPEIYQTVRAFPETFSYTQWECWLAILHKIDCLVIRDQGAFPAGLTDLNLLESQQRRHIQRLREIGHDLVAEFDTVDSACRSILKLEYLKQTLPEAMAQTSVSPYENREIVGFDDDREAVKDLLSVRSNSTVVIIGAGGTGKTTLAREVLTSIEEKQGAGIWVDLLRVSDVNGIYTEILSELYGVRTTERPPNLQSGAILDRVAAGLRDFPPKIIVLDNAEHIPDAVSEATTRLQEMLNGTAGILITSQQSLIQFLPEVSHHPISALQYVSADDLEQWNAAGVRLSESYLLLRRKSRGFLPPVDEDTWRPIAEICQGLKGVPLFLSLAGGFLANNPQVTVYELAGKVVENGAFFEPYDHGKYQKMDTAIAAAKTQSARASVEWSLQQCPGLDFDLLSTLATFPDGLSVGVLLKLNDSVDADIEAQIQRLLTGSILYSVRNEPRFRMVEAVRRHVQELMTARRQQSLHNCLAAMIRYVGSHERKLLLEPSEDLIRQLVTERGNVVGLVDEGIRLDACRGLAIELFSIYVALLDRVGPAQFLVDRYREYRPHLSSAEKSQRLRIVRFACRSLWACGDWQNAKTEISLFADELLRFHDTEHHSSEQRVDELLFLLDYVRLQTLSEAVCDGITPKLAVCENILSEIKSASDVLPDEAVFIESQYLVVKSRLMDRMGDGQRSISLIRDFLSSQRHFDHLSRYQNARLQNEIGLCSWHVGDLSSALKAFEAAAALFAELKNDLWLAGALTNLGFVHTDRENFSKAVEVCEQAHRLHHKVGNKAWELINLGALGMAFIWSNRFDEGIERLSSALDGAVENDPESAAQFKGDIGRALLVRNEARDLEKALMYLEEAVEVQLQNGKSRRLFGNQVLLAEASRRAGVTGDRLKTLTQSARETAESLNLTLGTNVLQVRRDVRLLENIETSLVPGK